MARVLIVGGGGRGRQLAQMLCAEGQVCRIVTRTQRVRPAIEHAGAECWIGDPGRLATVMGALEGASIACWLLGCAVGSDEEIGALHGARLEAFLQRLIDTSVRGILYEAAGTVPAELLMQGARTAAAIAQRNAIPLRLLDDAPPAERERWLAQAHGAVRELLGGGR